MKALLETVKAAGQDWEWYPSDSRMLKIVADDIVSELKASRDDSTSFSILDIGAGNGSALKIICDQAKNDGQRYAIEKSKILIDALPPDVFVVGTDFHQQTLIDKKVDVVFCNPPYSEFQDWMRRIVAEANCRLIYLIVPQRWKEDKTIADVIARRCGNLEDEDDIEEEYRREYRRTAGGVSVLDSTSFEDSEFRQARAQVDILKIKIRQRGWNDVDCAVDPFDLWFENTFKIAADECKEYEHTVHADGIKYEVVKGQNLIEHLEELYHRDFDALLDTYRALEKMDATLFRELGVNLDQVRGGLKARIAGLKNLYWKELFDNLDSITSRLTSGSRKKLLDKLTAHTSIDFSAANAYAVVVWAIKNANAYFDSQLVDLYFTLADKDNIRNYKSNKRLIEDGWRYQCNRREYSHYTLDYRLILERHNCFPSWGYEKENGLGGDTHDLLGDICTIAMNLGFNVETDSREIAWRPGEKNEFFRVNGELFMDVRCYQKGTVHIRIDQEFMKRFNVEAGRLNGWLKNPTEAKAETGIDEAAELFGTNFKLKTIPLLTADGPASGELFPELTA